MSFLHDLPIADLIAHYGYIAIFVIITLESAGLPLPGETVLLTSAAYAGSTGNINIAVVVAIAAAAAVLGDNAGYWVGRRWGLPLLLRKGHLIGLDHGRLKLGQYLFRRHGGKIVFFGRFTAMLRAYAAVLAGVNKLDARRFFAFNALGGVAWASIMGFGAYLCGRSIENVMGPVGLGLLAFVLLGAVALWLFMRRHEARLMAAAEAAIPGPLAEGLDGSDAPPRAAPAGSPAAPLTGADFESQVEALLTSRDTARSFTRARAVKDRPPGALPVWFKIAALLLVAAFGMTLASWAYGVTGGFYGHLAGRIGILGICLILSVPAAILIVVGRRLRSPQPPAAFEERTEDAISLAA
ncbi:membrane protein DedA, SNARE-associated domain [Methylobacterium phyllostachyos]|uniref:Membrane protein DedA, SNARE-associated domain n=1 Tax=Methylobacterium phyllostachyos TaxID=582672 RepID=A0A1H0KDI3_9HYPH|nr:membrane protein DedA, SNARE-associated domain [Methylobacterium phyllostachyos]